MKQNWFFIFLLIVQFYQSKTDSLNCIDTCATDSKSPSSNSSKQVNLVANRSCFCTLCDVHNDCCIDAQKPVDDSLSKLFECNLRLSVEESKIPSSLEEGSYVYSISKCPKYKDEIVKEKCEDESLSNEGFDNWIEDGRDILKLIPVYSNITKIIYKNIYCAICNIKDPELFKLSIFDLNVDLNDNIDFDFNSNVYDFKNQLKEKIEWQIYMKEYFLITQLDLRRCLKAYNFCPSSVISQSKNFEYQLTSRYCKNFTAYRFSSNQKVVLKNSYCAKCFQIEDIRCYQPELIEKPRHTIPVSIEFFLETNSLLLKSKLSTSFISNLIYSEDDLIFEYKTQKILNTKMMRLKHFIHEKDSRNYKNLSVFIICMTILLMTLIILVTIYLVDNSRNRI